jgi:hypothetical protein
MNGQLHDFIHIIGRTDLLIADDAGCQFGGAKAEKIAAMEDSHFLIAKESSGGRTVTHISRLSETDSDGELARLLGGAAVTEAVLENAREMKRMAAASRGGE